MDEKNASGRFYLKKHIPKPRRKNFWLKKHPDSIVYQGVFDIGSGDKSLATLLVLFLSTRKEYKPTIFFAKAFSE